MHLPEFVLLVVATIAAIAAGLAMVASNYGVARSLFCIAALSFGSLGIVWSVQSDGYPLWTQMLVSASCAAIAAAGLTYGLWELRGREAIEAKQVASAAPGTMQTIARPPDGKNSPSISAGRDVNIGHLGDVINQPASPPRVDLSSSEGVLVPANLPTPQLPSQIPPDRMALIYGTNVSIIRKFPHTILQIRGERMIVADLDPVTKNLTITTLRIFDDRDDIIASIDKDGFWVRNTNRKKRPDEHTLVVYDHNDQRVLKIQYLNASTISVEGVFRSKKFKPEYIVVSEDAMAILPRGPRLTRVVLEGDISIMID